MGLAEEKYMLFTTYRRDGRAVDTPVWLVGLPGGEIGFYSGSQTGKAKRLAHTPAVAVQACNSRGGETHGPRYTGSARVVTGAEREAIVSAIRAKYGLMATLSGVVMKVLSTVRRTPMQYGNIGIVVTLDPPAS